MVVAYERSYSHPYEEVFFQCEKALIEHDYEITAKDFKKGKILASKGILASFLNNRFGIVVYINIWSREGITYVFMQSKTIFWDSNIDVIPLFISLDLLIDYPGKSAMEPVAPQKCSIKSMIKNPHALCPKCKYQYASMSAIDSPDQEKAISICPRCHHQYYFTVSEQFKSKIDTFSKPSNEDMKSRKNLEIVTSIPVMYGTILAFFSFFVLFLFLDDLFIIILNIASFFYITSGTYYISKRKFRYGCILCGTAGVLLLPIGILGLFAADLAWKYHNWQA